MSEATQPVLGTDLLETVSSIVRGFSPRRPEQVQPDQDLETELGYNSLALAELSFALEDLFGLEPVDPDEAIKMRTVESICAFMAGRIVTDGLTMPEPDEVAAYLERYATV